jgi:hypothetical protein
VSRTGISCSFRSLMIFSASVNPPLPPSSIFGSFLAFVF